MPQATIVNAWQDGTHLNLAVRVREPAGDVEYIGRVSLEDLKNVAAPERKAALVAAVRAERDRSLATIGGSQPVLGMTGTVTL